MTPIICDKCKRKIAEGEEFYALSIGEMIDGEWQPSGQCEEADAYLCLKCTGGYL